MIRHSPVSIIRLFDYSIIPQARRAFTLVELLVVIAIIAVLSGILLSVTSGGAESARAAKCMANLRSLAQGVNGAALENDNKYPSAGSVATMGGLDSLAFKEAPGWISWLSNKGDPFGKQSGTPPRRAPKGIKECTFDEPNIDDATYAMTNTLVWKAVNKSSDVYLCPTHFKTRQKQRKVTNWSYVMNGWFGYTDESDPGAAKRNRSYGNLDKAADKLLLFAELPLALPSEKESMRDAILHYKATVNGENYNQNWGGEPEAIGFNHPQGKKHMCGHVVFADGHCEKLVSAGGSDGKSGGGAGGLTAEQLTALLCEGKDISFNGTSYQEIREED